MGTWGEQKVKKAKRRNATDTETKPTYKSEERTGGE